MRKGVQRADAASVRTEPATVGDVNEPIVLDLAVGAEACHSEVTLREHLPRAHPFPAVHRAKAILTRTNSTASTADNTLNVPGQCLPAFASMWAPVMLPVNDAQSVSECSN